MVRLVHPIVSYRGSRAKLVFTIVHFNYHLLLRLRVLQSMRLTPKLVQMIGDVVKDPKLTVLREEMIAAVRNDPDKPKPNPQPDPNPVIII